MLFIDDFLILALVLGFVNKNVEVLHIYLLKDFAGDKI